MRDLNPERGGNTADDQHSTPLANSEGDLVWPGAARPRKGLCSQRLMATVNTMHFSFWNTFERGDIVNYAEQRLKVEWPWPDWNMWSSKLQLASLWPFGMCSATPLPQNNINSVPFLAVLLKFKGIHRNHCIRCLYTHGLRTPMVSFLNVLNALEKNTYDY